MLDFYIKLKYNKVNKCIEEVFIDFDAGLMKCVINHSALAVIVKKGRFAEKVVKLAF